MKTKFTKALIGLVVTLGLSTTLMFSEGYSQEVRLHGATEATKISGFAGETSIVGVPNSQQDAVYGLSFEEKGDNPCYVTIQTEDIND